MNIYYITNVRLPTEKAHGIQIVEMCKAFSKIGYKVKLIIPNRNTSIINNKDKFVIEKIGTIDLLSNKLLMKFIPSVCYMVQLLSFSFSCLNVKVNKEDLIFTRDKIIAILIGMKNIHVVYEAHDSCTGTVIDKLVTKYATKIVSITKNIDRTWSKYGVKTIYAPDGVGDEFFTSIDKNEARQLLHLKTDEKIILYTGNLFSWKGVDTLLETGKQLANFQLYVVGGEKENIFLDYTNTYRLKNIHFIGNRPHAEIPTWLRAADILVIPNSAKTTKGSKDTSPLKLFEYLASGTPIVASKVSAIEEIVDESHVSFFIPDDAQSLMDTIMAVTKKQNTNNNRIYAKKYTWENRAKVICDEYDKSICI